MDRQFEEMSGARDARIVIPDALLAAVADELIGLIQNRGCDGGDVGLYARLILRRWRHDPGCADRTLAVELVAVPANSTRRFSTAVPGRSGRRERNRCAVRRLIAAYQPQRLLAGVNDLN